MKTERFRILRTGLVLIGAAATALAQAGAGTSGTGSAASRNKAGADPAFVQEAAIGGMAEVEMGRLAVQKAKDDRVRQFGQKMIDDHSKANDALQHAASQEGLSVPTALDEKHKQILAKLEKLSGAQFDSAYSKEMVKDHKEDVKLFEKEAKSSGSPVQKFAAETLPTLKNHLKMAEDLGSVTQASAH